MLFSRLLALRPEIQIVDRTGGEVRLLDVGVSQLAVPAGHFQVGMAQQSLEGKHVTAVSEEGDGGRVAQRVRRASYPRESDFQAANSHYRLQPSSAKWSAVVRQEKKIPFGHGWNRAAVADIVPEEALHLPADGNETLLVAFTQDFKHALIELQIGEPQSEEFGDPQPGIEQGQDDRIVALPQGGGGVHGIEQLLDLGGRKRGHDFFRHFGNFHPFKRVRRDDFFRYQPGKENPDTADVTIDAVFG